MKKIILLSLLSAMVLTGCNEDKFLEEKPLDFNSATNSYNTTADFDAACFVVGNILLILTTLEVSKDDKFNDTKDLQL